MILMPETVVVCTSSMATVGKTSILEMLLVLTHSLWKSHLQQEN